MKFRLILCSFAFLLAIITLLGLGANDFVIHQNGYMPTARSNVSLDNNRLSQGGAVLKSIDETTKFAWLGDIFYTDGYFFSLGDWFGWNRLWLSTIAVILIIISLYWKEMLYVGKRMKGVTPNTKPRASGDKERE